MKYESGLWNRVVIFPFTYPLILFPSDFFVGVFWLFITLSGETLAGIQWCEIKLSFSGLYAGWWVKLFSLLFSCLSVGSSLLPFLLYLPFFCIEIHFFHSHLSENCVSWALDTFGFRGGGVGQHLWPPQLTVFLRRQKASSVWHN